MEFTVRERKTRLINFMNNLEHSAKNGFEEEDISKFFKKSLLGRGDEGAVYVSRFKSHAQGVPNEAFVMKIVDLKKIFFSKNISEKIYNSTANQIYKIFLTRDALNKPSLLELLAMTMTNQLILQGICPHYTMNYYWDTNSDKKHVYMYNELANAGDFSDWSAHVHSTEMWFNALFQIFAGMYALKKYFNMLHTDAHLQNILVQKVKPGGFWKYIIDGQNYYVPNLGYVFLIHDFGHGWIPNGMGTHWHSAKMNNINPLCKEFYDVNEFLDSLYKMPRKIKKAIDEELNDIFKCITDEDFFNKKIKRKSSQTTIGDKIFELFRGKYIVDYSVKIDESKKLHTYSLDKDFDKSYLPRNLRKFARKV